jgi:hypothetical protein
MEDGQRRYSDREIRSILHYALKIQQGEGRALDTAEGLSPQEIESVAGEVGIPPGLIRKAIDEYETQRSARISVTFFGEPVRFVHEETVHQHLTPQEIEEVRTQIGTIQLISSQGSGISAVSWGTNISIVADKDGTNLKIVDNLYAPAGGIFGGLIGGLGLGGGFGVGLGVGIAVLGSPLFMVAVPLAFLALSYVLARWVYKRTVRIRHQRALKLLDQIRSLIMQKRV